VTFISSFFLSTVDASFIKLFLGDLNNGFKYLGFDLAHFLFGDSTVSGFIYLDAFGVTEITYEKLSCYIDGVGGGNG